MTLEAMSLCWYSLVVKQVPGKDQRQVQFSLPAPFIKIRARKSSFFTLIIVIVNIKNMV